MALAELRAALAEAGYTDEVVSEPRRLHRFLAGTAATAVVGLDERLAALVRLFALGERVPAAVARDALAQLDLDAIQAAGLLTVDGDWAVPEYRLVPHGRLFIAGDVTRPDDPNVVSAFTGPSLKLIRLTPRAPVHSMLDVGAGSGVLALLGAQHCDHVTATDVNPRALTFARFNAELNGVSNLELLEGSWFEPAAGRHFDLITCNPPYVVSPDRDFAYRDSGLPAGELLERLTRQAGEHLAPGGLAIILCNWPHATEEDWDGPPLAAAASTGCDTLVLGSGTVDPFDYAVSWNSPPVSFVAPSALRETVARWLDYYRTTGVGAISFGAMILRRRTHGRRWVSALKTHADVGDHAAEQLTAVLAGHDLLEELDDQALLALRFSLPDGVDVSQRFRRRESRFLARPAMVRLDGGLGLSAAVDPDALDVVFACDGQRTLSEAAERVAERRGADVEASNQMATDAVRELLRHGLLSGA